MAGTFRLGVMALYLNGNRLEELPFFRRLLKEARRMGIEAYVYTPEDVDDGKRRVLAHVYEEGRGWQRRWMPFPDVVFDRCRYQNTPRFRKLREFRGRYGDLLYMNRPLANKWAIHQLLHKDKDIRPHLPESVMYRGAGALADFVKKHGIAFVKPVNGTGGRGVVRIERAGDGRFQVRGRDKQRRILPKLRGSAEGVGRLIARLGLADNSLMQQGIELTLPNGRVHDYRMLVQKTGEGRWEVTGCAGRVGAERSVTSNLHGGGKAVAAGKLLRKTFGSESKASAVEEDMRELGLLVVKRLEDHYRDMCELALDLAVDRDGRVWLLEINPKPAREVFRRIGESETYRRAIRTPVEYARWLYERERKK
ncbi:YheC/YheD family protein [Paenibacillus sp.]|uniref:YheC/YheD family endospore coat-associated protein n=1 Tax=Paenibacillus sp. TaxID=58172 RepID=UPI002D6819A2|nr:YheC/YheD family protein [Paenibacillus sp.]HZG83599.1 YheC/YheD family protein [Paenibacillus sp.]